MRFQFPDLCKRYAALAVGGLLLSATSALAGPTYFFATSVGTQPSNVGTVVLTQVNSTTVDVLVDLADTSLPLPQYGFVNTGGPHTPFVFTLAGTESGVSANFLQPVGGLYTFGLFSLNLPCSTTPMDCQATPFGTFGVGIDSTAGNGTGKAYFGDLEFNLIRTSGLSTDDFITNSALAYFAADLTNGGPTDLATGSQAWKTRLPEGGIDPNCVPGTCTVPEPATLALLGLGLAGLGFSRRKQ